MRLLAVLIGALWLCCQAAQAQVRNYDEMIAAGELKVAVYRDFAPTALNAPESPRVSMSSSPRPWPRRSACA